jgi:hypothetical protein
MNRCDDPNKKITKGIDFLFSQELISDEGGIFYDLWSEAKRNEKVRKSFAEVYAMFREILFESLVETGMVSPDSRKETIRFCSMLIAMYEGIYVQWDLDRENVSLKEMKELFRAYVEEFLKRKI